MNARYRFRVRAPGGQEVISAEVVVHGDAAPAGAAGAAGGPGGEASGPTPLPPIILGPPEWGEEEHHHGEEAALAVAAPVDDGRRVRFVVEQEDGKGGWEPFKEAEAEVRGGRAEALVEVAHPKAGADEDHPGHALRARAELLPA